MFIIYSIVGILATFLVFSHGYEGNEYTFSIGLALIVLFVCRKLEKGDSLHSVLFTLVFYPMIGAICLSLYQYKGSIVDNLDQLMVCYFAYLAVFVSVGMLATVTFLFKLLISTLLNKRVKKIRSVNQKIYMSGSGQDYLSKKDTSNKEDFSKKLAHVSVFLFILVTTLAFYMMRYLPLNSELINFHMTPFKGLIICSIWYTTVFYVFNCGLMMLGSHLFVVLAGILFNLVIKSSSFAGDINTITVLQNLGMSVGLFFLPALIMFFVREFRFITSFEDY